MINHPQQLYAIAKTKLGMSLVNSGQYNFPNFCRDATTVVLYLFLKFSIDCKHNFEKIKKRKYVVPVFIYRN